MDILEQKTERLTLRVTPSQKNILTQAAALRGRSLTDFVVETSQTKAEDTLRERQVIHLSTEAQLHLAETLLNPPEPNDALKEAAHRYDDMSITSK